MESLKIIGARKAKSINYKNTKYKLLKTNAAIRCIKMYRSSHLTPKYINVQFNGSFEHTIEFSLKMAQ